MQPSKQLSIFDTISSIASQLFFSFGTFFLPLFALSGGGGGSASSSFAMSSSRSLPSSCTAASHQQQYRFAYNAEHDRCDPTYHHHAGGRWIGTVKLHVAILQRATEMASLQSRDCALCGAK